MLVDADHIKCVYYLTNDIKYLWHWNLSTKQQTAINKIEQEIL